MPGALTWTPGGPRCAPPPRPPWPPPDDLAAILTAEQGKPLKAAAFEVAEMARWLEYSAGLDLPRAVLQDDEQGHAELVHRPLGVVAAITPWNYPLLLAGWKLGPALLAGNTVVLKPSPFTPLSTLALGRILAGVLPPGVLNVVSGGDELGAWMTSHPAVAKISFTGSVPTGKAVAAAAAPDLKRFTLELGGNDAAIVLDDADPAVIERGLFWGAFINNGQICAGIKRIYVPERLHGDVVEALAHRASRVRVGAGTDAGVQLGPIQNRPQFDRVTRPGRRRPGPRRDGRSGRPPDGPGRLLLRAHHPDRGGRGHADRRRGAVRPGCAGDQLPGSSTTRWPGPTTPATACLARSGAPTPTGPPRSRSGSNAAPRS